MANEEDKIREELKEVFKQGMVNEIELNLIPEATQNEESKDLESFIKDLASLSDKIKFAISSSTESEGPVLTVGANLGYKISFLGAPSGLEIQSLIKAIILASQGENAVQANLREISKKITQSHEIDVFVSAKCSDCPMPVFYLLSTAVSNPDKVSARVIMTSSFPSLSKEREVKHLPTFFTDGIRAPIETDKISIGLYFDFIKGLCA